MRDGLASHVQRPRTESRVEWLLPRLARPTSTTEAEREPEGALERARLYCKLMRWCGACLPVEFGEVDGLVLAAGDCAGEAIEVVESGVDLCGGDSAVGEEGGLSWGQGEEVRVLRSGDCGKGAGLLVVGVEEEELVTEDGAAGAAAELLTEIVWLDWAGRDDAVVVAGRDGEGVGRT